VLLEQDLDELIVYHSVISSQLLSHGSGLKGLPEPAVLSFLCVQVAAVVVGLTATSTTIKYQAATMQFTQPFCIQSVLPSQVAAVVVGFDRHINYYKIQMATLCIRENPGCMFIATNLGARG